MEDCGERGPRIQSSARIVRDDHCCAQRCDIARTIRDTRLECVLPAILIVAPTRRFKLKRSREGHRHIPEACDWIDRGLDGAVLVQDAKGDAIHTRTYIGQLS